MRVFKLIAILAILLINTNVYSDTDKVSAGFDKFKSKFTTLNFPFVTSSYKITFGVAIDTSITKEFVASVFNSNRTIIPIGKYSTSNTVVLVWKEGIVNSEVWSLATFYPNGDKHDLIEIKRTGGNVSIESIVDSELSVNMTIKDKNNNSSQKLTLKVTDYGGIIWPGTATIVSLNYLNIKNKGREVIPVIFEKGKNGVTIRSSVLPEAADHYKFSAQKGQKCTIKLISNNSFNYFSFSTRDSSIVDHGTILNWTGKLPVTGEYYIDVGLIRAEARRRKLKLDYALYLEIK